MRKFNAYSKLLIFLLIILTVSCNGQSTKKEKFKIEMSSPEFWVPTSQLNDVYDILDSIYYNSESDSIFRQSGEFKVIGSDTLYQFIKYSQNNKMMPPPPPVVNEIRSSPMNKKSGKKTTKAIMTDDMDITDVDIPQPIVRAQPIVVEEIRSEPPPQFKDKSTSKVVNPLQTPITLDVSDIKMDSMVSPKVDNIEIKFGSLVYHIPDTMVKKKTYTIRLRINRDTTDKSILVVDDNEKMESTTIKTTSKMEVLIVDPSPPENKSFEIVKSNDDKQIVDDDSYTEWIYSVTPLRSGNLKLNIIISIVRDNNKKQIVYFKDIIVKSNPGADVIDFIKKYWQWMISTLIIPLVVWWWKNRKKKRVGRPKKS